MRLLTAISIVSLVVSIAAVVFVLGLYEELEKSEAPVANLTEKEAIAIARSSTKDTPVTHNRGPRCWLTEPHLSPGSSNIPNNFSHTESATFKPNGMWVVIAKSSWNWKNKSGSWSGGECAYVVDDVTGRVMSN